MAFTYDPTTDRGRVRLAIADRDDTTADNQIFTDAEIDSFLATETAWQLAAANALEAMANDQAIILKKMSLLDLTIDGPAVAASLRDGAKRLRDEYDAGDAGDFDYAEMVVSDSSLAERLFKEAQRQS